MSCLHCLAEETDKGSSALHAFQNFVNTTNHNDSEEEEAVNRILQRGGTITPDTASRYTIFRRKIREKEFRHGHDLDSLILILAESSTGLRGACADGVKGAAEWFRDCNSGRWTGFLSGQDENKIEARHQALVDHLRRIHEALDEFKKVERVKLIKPFEKFFDPRTGRLLESETSEGKNDIAFSARSWHFCTRTRTCKMLKGGIQVIVHMFSLFRYPRWVCRAFSQVSQHPR